jgi:O-antigen/teichoic acid export membrane protein
MNVIRNSILSIIGTGSFAAMSLLVGVILARILAPEGFGQYALVTSTVGLLATIGSMGLEGALIYWMNKRGMDMVAASTLMIRASAALGFLAATVCVLFLQDDGYFGALPITAVIAAGLFVLGQVVIAASKGVFMATMQVRRYVVVQVTPVAVLLSIVAIAAMSGELTLQSALVASAIGQALGVAVLYWFLRNDINWERPFRLRELTPLLRYGGIINLAYFLYVFGIEGGVLLLRVFSGQFEQLGYYRVAIRLASVVLMATAAVGPLLFSKYASSNDDARTRNVERTSRVFWIAIPCIVIILELISNPVVMFLYGETFVPAVQVFRIVLIGVAARALTGPILEMFYSCGVPRFSAAILGLNLLVMSALMAAYIPQYAAVGAASAFAISNVVALTAAYFVARSKFDVRLRQCFVITRRDVHFVFTSLHPADHRALL